VVAQAAYAATSLGLPAIAPAIREHYGLTLTQVGSSSPPATSVRS
jgi:hypothetical protein